MDRRTFERIVDEALEEIPEEILERIDNVAVVVADRPPHDVDPDGTLLGLYEGVSLKDRGIDYTAVLPDTITIYREPHLALGLDEAGLRAEIRKTVLHEIAHHLGIDERRLHQLGWD